MAEHRHKPRAATGPAVVTIHPGRYRSAPKKLLERAVRHTLTAEGVQGGEVSVALLNDESIQRLNREHLDHDRPTDVLAFALHDAGEPPLGDVYLGVPQARRQADDAGVGETEELVRLAVHGTLHVLGWDHPDAAEARLRSPMWARQETLVAEVMRRR
jgi:probable rRNA maturation factor